mmetsp:Transcript_27788/g.88201  ORF Transcript_27788/g.88201 Transcript_27788/m.88201 type:complete len:203 (+) Transcript_27788:372-980(+)
MGGVPDDLKARGCALALSPDDAVLAAATVDGRLGVFDADPAAAAASAPPALRLAADANCGRIMEMWFQAERSIVLNTPEHEAVIFDIREDGLAARQRFPNPNPKPNSNPNPNPKPQPKPQPEGSSSTRRGRTSPAPRRCTALGRGWGSAGCCTSGARAGRSTPSRGEGLAEGLAAAAARGTPPPTTSPRASWRACWPTPAAP